MDVIANRSLIAKLRKIALKIPFLWGLYGVYWKIRVWKESKTTYPSKTILCDFGSFPEPNLENVSSQLCTANQIFSKKYKSWCKALNSPPRFSRKQWEFVFILEALKQNNMLRTNVKGLGFGCGREPLTGIFASNGCNIIATDLAENEAFEKGWVNTYQHASNLQALHDSASKSISWEDFKSRVQFQSVDMNQIPKDFHGRYDFVWSACALEHLGSLKHGMDFIKNSVLCLKPGGIAVHTTEFNLSSNDKTLESPSCSIYREKDIQQLIQDLEASAFAKVYPLNLNYGEHNIDTYIDLPPYGFSPHLKLELQGYSVTSIGLIIKRL